MLFNSHSVLRHTAIMVEGREAFQGGSCSAVVLAGGKSRRFGMDKALLELQGQSLLARTVSKLATLSEDIIVVTNNPEHYEHLGLDARFVRDERPGAGALMGVYSGLKEAIHGCALVVACDMPFLNVSLLRYMMPKSVECDVVIPRVQGLLEPLCAIYSKRCLRSMATLLAQGSKQIIGFFDKVEVCYVDAHEIIMFDPLHLSFLNVNSPEDWRRAQDLLARLESTCSALPSRLSPDARS